MINNAYRRVANGRPNQSSNLRHCTTFPLYAHRDSKLKCSSMCPLSLLAVKISCAVPGYDIRTPVCDCSPAILGVPGLIVCSNFSLLLVGPSLQRSRNDVGLRLSRIPSASGSLTWGAHTNSSASLCKDARSAGTWACTHAIVTPRATSCENAVILDSCPTFFKSGWRLVLSPRRFQALKCSN